MPKALAQWQVFPHRPIEKLEPNLWRVEGDIPFQKGTRVMTVARMQDGGLVIHNAIALDEPAMKELEAFGTPRLLVVPNGFHRLDARIYKQRYPSLRVICPAGARKKVAEVVPVDGTYAEAPADDTVRLSHLAGTKDREGVLEVRSDGKSTVVFNDSINNLPKMGGVMGFVLAPTGQPSVPRLARWLMISDKAAFRAHLTKLAEAPGLARIIVSHGAMLSSQAADTLRTVAATLS